MHFEGPVAAGSRRSRSVWKLWTLSELGCGFVDSIAILVGPCIPLLSVFRAIGVQIIGTPLDKRLPADRHGFGYIAIRILGTLLGSMPKAVRSGFGFIAIRILGTLLGSVPLAVNSVPGGTNGSHSLQFFWRHLETAADGLGEGEVGAERIPVNGVGRPEY